MCVCLTCMKDVLLSSKTPEKWYKTSPKSYMQNILEWCHKPLTHAKQKNQSGLSGRHTAVSDKGHGHVRGHGRVT